MDLFSPAGIDEQADPDRLLVLAELEIEADDDAGERQIGQTPDGWLYDVKTGEVLGLAEDVDDEGAKLGLRGVERRYEIDSQDAADWALMVRTNIEADVIALQERRRALIANIDALIAERRRRLSWWAWRFEPSLIAFARPLLKGKSRTVNFVWGKVAFRKTKGTTAIIDNATAIEYVETFAPKLVKVVKSVNVTSVLEAAKVAEDATGEPQDAQLSAFLARSGESESVTVSTGLEVPGGKRGD